MLSGLELSVAVKLVPSLEPLQTLKLLRILGLLQILELNLSMGTSLKIDKIWDKFLMILMVMLLLGS